MLLWLILILDSSLSLPPAPAQPSLFYEYTVSQSGISWWLNKLFDFWIILRLTEFWNVGCLQCLAGTKRWACYWQRDLHMTFFFFYHYSPANYCSLQPGLAAWKGAARPSSKVQFIIFSLLWTSTWHTTSAWETRHIFDRNQVTLPIILQFLRTCIISQMHKSYHARIILWVSWIRMSLELIKGFCVWALQSCPWSQRKPSNFTAALGTQSVDSMINKHPLSSRFP